MTAKQLTDYLRALIRKHGAQKRWFELQTR
jgi:hypothetical protein